MVAWFLVVCHSVNPLKGRVVVYDVNAENNDIVEFEMDAMGADSFIDNLGAPPSIGIWLFVCSSIQHFNAISFEADAETDFGGEYRALNEKELESLCDDPDLERFHPIVDGAPVCLTDNVNSNEERGPVTAVITLTFQTECPRMSDISRDALNPHAIDSKS